MLSVLSGQMKPLEEKNHIFKRFYGPGLSEQKTLCSLTVVPLRITCKQVITLSLTFSILDVSRIFLVGTRTLCTVVVK